MLKRTLLAATLGCAAAPLALAQQADLRLTMFAPDTVHVGQQFTIFLIVDNLGPDQSVQPEVNLEAITSPNQWVNANGCSIAVRTMGGLVDEFNCNFARSTGFVQLGEFGANWLNAQSGTDEGRMLATVDLQIEDKGFVSFRSYVAADTPDPNHLNDVVITDVVVLDAAADLSVDLTSQTMPGGMIDYRAVAVNLGPSDTNDTELVIALPGSPAAAARHLEIVSLSPGAVYDPATNTVTLAGLSLRLPFNEEAMIDVSIFWNGRPVNIEATATIADAVIPDPDPENNTHVDVQNGRGGGPN